MRFSQLSLFTSLMLSGAMAAPASAPAQSSSSAGRAAVAMAKRQAGAGVHLVNCDEDYSVVIYCPDDGNCNRVPASRNAFRLRYEGTWVDTTTLGTPFSTGVTFYFRFENKGAGEFEQAGVATNTYHNWRVFKDDEHVMYEDADGKECKSMFYALTDDDVVW